MNRSILHLIPSTGGGGAERQLAYLAVRLVELGWETHVAYVKAGDCLERMNSAGVTTHALRSRSNYDLRLLVQIVGLVRRVKPPVLQTWLPMMDLLGGPVALLTGVPWILSERSNSAFETHRRKVRIRGQVGRLASAVVSNSEAGNAYWAERIRRPARTLSLPNALPLSEIAAAPRADRGRLGLSDSLPLVLALSRFVDFKNFETMFDAFEILIVKSDAQILVCGDGLMRPYIEERLRNEALRARVVLPGYVDDPWSWYKAADVFVSVSRYEGMPNTVMEAMAAGCPVVASDIPHHREILDDDSARFAPTHDAGAVADALLAALADPAPEERVRAAQERANTFTIESVASRWEALYRELAEARGGVAT